MKKLLIFLVILVPSVALLYFSLTRNPRDLPSALVNRPAPDFDLAAMDGGRVALRDVKGSPLVLNFWSTWCGPCVGEHRIIREAQKASEPAGIRFYSILYEDTPENAKEFVQRHGKAAPILLDPDLKTAIDYGVAGVPETFFIDRRGVILYKHAGMLTREILDSKIGELEF